MATSMSRFAVDGWASRIARHYSPGGLGAEEDLSGLGEYTRRELRAAGHPGYVWDEAAQTYRATITEEDIGAILDAARGPIVLARAEARALRTIIDAIAAGSSVLLGYWRLIPTGETVVRAEQAAPVVEIEPSGSPGQRVYCGFCTSTTYCAGLPTDYRCTHCGRSGLAVSLELISVATPDAHPTSALIGEARVGWPATPPIWTTRHAAHAWGVTPAQVRLYAVQGRIPGAYKAGREWLIPAGAPKPPGLPEGGAAHRTASA